MTKQTPSAHARTLRSYEPNVGCMDKLLTEKEKQDEREGKIKIHRVLVWVHPPDILQKSTPTKVPIDYTKDGVTKTVGKELYIIEQVKFIDNINI